MSLVLLYVRISGRDSELIFLMINTYGIELGIAVARYLIEGGKRGRICQLDE